MAGELTLAVRNKLTNSWDSLWFYCRVPSEQLTDVQGKGSYLLRSTMTLLDCLNDSPFECSLEDADVAAFVEATSTIGSRDTLEEFLTCGIWPLGDTCNFGVEIRETPLLKVMVPMPMVTWVIGTKEYEVTFERGLWVPLTC
jgi:hypothetical protein